MAVTALNGSAQVITEPAGSWTGGVSLGGTTAAAPPSPKATTSTKTRSAQSRA
ncbi:hypothetical protein [Streptomyces cirratus]|uniref:hypothetical protein n=1 Tax=Streptomyces cirratus TaxID=68187 RepID=UPI0036131004